MNLAELFITLGFKADTLKLKEFIGAIGELNMRSVMSAIGLGTLFEATSKIMNAADKASMNVWSFGQITGMATKPMQQFSNLAEQMGSSAEDAQASIKNLQSGLLQVKLGQGNIQPYILAGIDPTKVKNSMDLLQKIQKYVRDSSATDDVKRMVVAQFGLSESLIPVLKNTKNINEAIKDQRYIFEEEQKRMLEFHKVNKMLGQDMTILWTQTASSITPVIDKLITLSDKLVGVTRTGKGFGLFLKEIAMDILNMSPLANALKIEGAAAKIAFASPQNSSTNNLDVKINIDGSKEPHKVAETVAEKLRTMLTDTAYSNKYSRL